MSALFIILVSLTMTLFSEKLLISNRCISGLMPNLIKKSWKDSRRDVYKYYLLTYIKEVFAHTVAWLDWSSSCFQGGISQVVYPRSYILGVTVSVYLYLTISPKTPEGRNLQVVFNYVCGVDCWQNECWRSWTAHPAILVAPMLCM